ncbi:receptor-mediated endocytosis protein 6 homolog isoform X2 [Sitophilus oryzae]|uniref:Receptor-mediated endocytosis protein 6 homolog n=1 Tax=Sitophilus oryzae TaxID=7048 RepID=A0A6J2X4E7_SITOR|nr:receptor-mediated endocytosis protein 6 homolog isoform X2 [Sitophilus oryzae]
MKNEEEEYDLYAFAVKLRQENLLIKCEKLDIQKLNEDVRAKTHTVIKASWLTNKQKLFLFESDQKFDFIHNSEFVDAKSTLGFSNAVKMSNLLHTLRSQPKQLAKSLVAGESLAEDSLQYSLLLQSILNGLYSGCLFADDTKLLLSLLLELAKQQLVKSDNPRRLIQQKTCSFRRLYFMFHEIYQPAKFFLNAALEMPILELVSFADHYLDVDHDQTMGRFREGVNMESYKDAVQYRNEVALKLANYTNTFVRSLLENVYSFPKALAWLVCHIYQMIEKNFCTKEANAIISDLIFTFFLCPVIVKPEEYGMINSKLTEITRHNLTQVVKLLQILALYKFEGIDPKHADIFATVDKEGISNFIEIILTDMDCLEAPVDVSPKISRDIMLFTEEELNNWVCFLQKVQSKSNASLSESVEEYLSSLTILSSTDNSPKTHRTNSDGKKAFFSLSSKNHHSRRLSEDDKKIDTTTVIIFPIDGVIFEPIGLLPEEKVIDLSVPIKNDSGVFDGPENPKENPSLKANFGFIDESSDNLEAISEAASNHSVASSLELENEEDDQNDNLSDMVSANVSGRGTPNISGRDTPSSQVNENEERVNAENRQENVTNQPNQQNISRQIRSEIDDKFCKFEIKKLIEGDETISIISETWSTDVLSSDTETVDANESRAERHHLHLVDQAIREVPLAENVLDISETQSEGAWSTDVAASDTERLIEDNDDAASVAQSDDTNSVARSDDTRSETDEAASARRLSSCSSTFGAAGGGGSGVGAGQSYVANVAVNTTSYVAVSLNSPSYGISTAHYKSPETNFVSVNHNYVTFQEFKRPDNRPNGKICTETDNNANTVYKTTTRGLFGSKMTLTSKTNDGSGPGPSGLSPKTNHRDTDGDSHYSKTQNNIGKKYGDRPTEILLSNCSLNSSGSSSNSFENKASATENSDQWDTKPWLNSSGSSLNVTLTPSESTSELSSVLSVNNLGHPAGAIKKSSTVTARTLKPSASTGAIPKSISFDMSVDKGLDDESRTKRGGFFGKLKNGFRYKKRSFRNQDDLRGTEEDLTGALAKRGSIDCSDDILAKYRPKGFAESSPIKENGTMKKPAKNPTSENLDSEANSLGDIKKKLRLVLANLAEIPLYIKRNPRSIKAKLETILRLELGKARKLRDWSQVARVSEAVRCVNLLDDVSCLKLLQSMRDDVLLRSTYIQYLIVSKQELLFCEMYLNTLHEQILNEKRQCETFFATDCVQKFVEEQEQIITVFCEEFRQLSLADEKFDSLQTFYKRLYALAHERRHWQHVLQKRGALIKSVLERNIMGRVYSNALYPNGDGDRDRDRVLREHISNLSRIITPDHKDLLIPKTYLRESPWLPAQEALRALDIARTPKDKLQCVLRCARCIMDLLTLSQNRGSATADDFTPVLVYVIIQVNPGALLSTIQFVNSFQGQILGEEEYWWTQFCSAVEYIKTMDYTD